MSDSPRPDSPEPTDPYPDPAYSDPAYAGGGPYGSYSPAYIPPTPSQTEPLPAYWTQTYQQTGVAPAGPGDRPPQPPRGPRPWLWALAGFAVATVIGLIVWLVFANTNPSKQETSITAEPQPSMTTTRAPTPTTRPSLPSRIPPIPLPTLPGPGGPGPGSSGETESVDYEVTGQGRAISIVYADTGGMMQFEYNVELPWSKKVDLPKPAQDSASITVVNSGRNVSCSISIGGAQVVKRTGALLTVCGPAR